MKERSDKALNIELDAVDFTSTLENHFQTMEKYKAYAEGTKMLNAFFNTPSVAMLIEQMGMRQPIKQAVNFAINPNAGMKSNLSNKFLDGMQVRFTGFALSFKAIQILKQATSFINAYEEYSFFNKDSKVPNVVKSALDPIMFMVGQPLGIYWGAETNGVYSNWDEAIESGIAGAAPGEIKYVNQRVPTINLRLIEPCRLLLQP